MDTTTAPETTKTDCRGCEWIGYKHTHNPAEDGPEADCCTHTCKD